MVGLHDTSFLPITSPTLRADNAATLSNGELHVVGTTRWFANYSPAARADQRLRAGSVPRAGDTGAPATGESPLWLDADLLAKYYELPRGLVDLQLVFYPREFKGTYRIGFSPDETMEDRRAWVSKRRDPNIVMNWDPITGRGIVEPVSEETWEWFTHQLEEHPRHCYMGLLLDNLRARPSKFINTPTAIER